jgi:hypothetical protein
MELNTGWDYFFVALLPFAAHIGCLIVAVIQNLAERW